VHDFAMLAVASNRGVVAYFLDELRESLALVASTWLPGLRLEG